MLKGFIDPQKFRLFEPFWLIAVDLIEDNWTQAEPTFIWKMLKTFKTTAERYVIEILSVPYMSASK